METKKCPCCLGKIEAEVAQCPHCGKRFKSRVSRNTIVIIVSAVIGIVVVSTVVHYLVQYVNARQEVTFVPAQTATEIIDVPMEKQVVAEEPEEEEYETYAVDAGIIKNKTYFYESPEDESTKTKAYLVSGDEVTIDDYYNGWGYATYTNAKGRVTKGWIKMSDVLTND